MSEDSAPAPGPAGDPTEHSRWRPVFDLQRDMDDEIARIYAENGIPDLKPTWVMEIVRLHFGGPMTIADLARSVGRTHSAMSQKVAAMRAAGWLKTSPGADARAKLVSLTPRAERVAGKLAAEWRATEATIAEIEAEVPYPMTRVAADIRTVLARKSFHDRIAEKLAADPGWSDSSRLSGIIGFMLTAAWRRVLLTVLAVGAVAAIVTWQRHTISRSFGVLEAASLGWLLLAAAAEAASLTAFGLSRRTLLHANGHRIRLRAVMAVTYASNALAQSIPFAGTELAVVYSYRRFRDAGLNAATTSWALTVSWMCSTGSLALLLISGAIANPAAAGTAAGFAGAAVYLLPPAAVLLALRFTRVRRGLHDVLAWVARLLKRMFGKPERGADGLEEFLDEVSRTTLPGSGYGLAFVTAILNWGLDCGALGLAIAAMGQPVPWASLLLVYGAGAAVGSTGLTPGGFLLVELAMSAALTASGVPGPKAVAAVLAYRVVNFWLVLLGGWVTMAFLTHPVAKWLRLRRRS